MLGHLRRPERGETPPQCFDALRQEVRSVGVEDAFAEREERWIGRACFIEKEPRAVELDATLQHLLEDLPLRPQRVENLELPSLDEVSVPEALAYQTKRLLAHRDAAHLDRTILESGVLMTELVERLTPEDEHPWPAVLEMEHVVVDQEPDMAAAGAAFIRVDVEVIDEAFRGPAGHREEDREERDAASEATDHCRVS